MHPAFFVREVTMRHIPCLFLLCLLLPAAAVRATTPADPGGRPPYSYAQVVKKVAPAVVNIYTKRREQVRSPFSPFANDPLFQEFFGESFGMLGIPRDRVVRSLGSGVIIGPDGLIVTSYHVIDNSDQITVVLLDRREFAAELVATDKASDLALLRIDTGGETLPYLSTKPYHALEVGDVVLAIGNPFGVGQSVSRGIISALSRAAVGVSKNLSFIQTDAAINPGNSGGALVAMDGSLIGINAAIYSKSGGSLGIGFAIPAGMIRALVEAARSDGVVRRPWLGVSVQPVDYETAESLGMAAPQGVLVTHISTGSPAAAAGLREGDILLSIDRYRLYGEHDLRFHESMTDAGAASLLQVLREGDVLQMRVKLEVPADETGGTAAMLKGKHMLSGLVVADLHPRRLQELGLDADIEGVLIVEVDRNSRAARLGVRPGDIILEVSGKEVDSVEELQEIAEGLSAYGLRMTLLRNGQVLQIVVQH